MPFADDLKAEVNEIFVDIWKTRDGRVVPLPTDLQLGNDGVKLNAVVLYADLDGSTKLVDSHSPEFSAEVYKAYLVCAARIIKSEGGSITAYDGDRIMGVFIGDSKCSDAARCALKINYAVSNIINPTLKSVYKNKDYVVKHAIGIDVTELLVARIGVRNDNDLVWVGRSANYAAKLAAFNELEPIYITGDVFDQLSNTTKYGGENNQLMWKQKHWPQMNNMRVHGCSWTWSI